MSVPKNLVTHLSSPSTVNQTLFCSYAVQNSQQFQYFAISLPVVGQVFSIMDMITSIDPSVETKLVGCLCFLFKLSLQYILITGIIFAFPLWQMRIYLFFISIP